MQPANGSRSVRTGFAVLLSCVCVCVRVCRVCVSFFFPPSLPPSHPSFQPLWCLPAPSPPHASLSLPSHASPPRRLIAPGCSRLGQLLVWEWQSESYVLKQQGHFYDTDVVAFR